MSFPISTSNASSNGVAGPIPGDGTRLTISRLTRRRNHETHIHYVNGIGGDDGPCRMLFRVSECNRAQARCLQGREGSLAGIKESAGIDRSPQGGAKRSLMRGGVMATRTVKRTVGLFVLGSALAFMMSGIL